MPIHGHMLKTAFAQMITDKCQSYVDLIRKYDYPDGNGRKHVSGCAYLYAHLFSRFVVEPATVLANYESLVDACESRHGLRYEHRNQAILIFRAMADFYQFNELYVAVKSATTVVEVPQVPEPSAENNSSSIVPISMRRPLSNVVQNQSTIIIPAEHIPHPEVLSDEPRPPLSLSPVEPCNERPVESCQQVSSIEQYQTRQCQPSTSSSPQYNHSPNRSMSPVVKRRALSPADFSQYE